MKFRFILILAIFISCQTDKTSYAPTQDYFYELSDLKQNSVSTGDLAQINSWLPEYKYFISWQSGNSWPFFEEFELDRPVPKDSLMTPHTHVHRFRPLSEFDPTRASNSIRIQIDYTMDELDQPLVGVVLFEWKNNNWTKLVDTGNHTILQKHYTTPDERQLYTFQTIVRYSFK